MIALMIALIILFTPRRILRPALRTSRVCLASKPQPAASTLDAERGTRSSAWGRALTSRSWVRILTSPPRVRPRWFGIDRLREPRLVTWAAAAADLEELASRAAQAGVGLGPIGQGQRTRSDGATLSWRFTDPAVVSCDGLVPFLIDWGLSPHPAVTAPAGGELLALRSEHPDHASVEWRLRALGLDLPVSHGSVPALVATIRTRRGDVELR